jgi:copper transport protein
LPVTVQQAPAAQLAIHIHSERAMLQVVISPGTVGTDGFVVQLSAGDGQLQDDFDVPARSKGP